MIENITTFGSISSIIHLVNPWVISGFVQLSQYPHRFFHQIAMPQTDIFFVRKRQTWQFFWLFSNILRSSFDENLPHARSHLFFGYRASIVYFFTFFVQSYRSYTKKSRVQPNFSVEPGSSYGRSAKNGNKVTKWRIIILFRSIARTKRGTYKSSRSYGCCLFCRYNAHPKSAQEARC